MLELFYSLSAFFVHHTSLTYVILFLGSICESLFPLSIFIYGEIFFIGGALLAGSGVLNIWTVFFLCIVGGVIGDNVSYLLGRKYGISWFESLQKKRVFSKFLTQENKKKGELFFKKYGGLSVFLARFSGPLARITPFFAGTLKLKYRNFIFFDTAGAIGGISIFIVAGYFFGKHFQIILRNIFLYIFLILFCAIIIFIFYKLLKKNILTKQKTKEFKQKKKAIFKAFMRHVFFYTSFIIFIYCIFLYSIFFIFETRQQLGSLMTFSKDIKNIELLKNISSFGTSFPHSQKIVQPINIILISDTDVGTIFEKLGWIQNISFFEESINLKNFIELFEKKELPVTTLEFQGAPQNSAFQIPSNSNKKRTHIRFWDYGRIGTKYIYFGSISDDQEIALRFYNYFITPIHEISPNIDIPRDKLRSEIEKIFENAEISYGQGGEISSPETESPFISDGKILFIEL